MKARSTLCALLLGCAVATSVSAQNIAPDVDVATAAGQIAIVDSADGWARHLHVGDTVFFGNDAYRFVNVIDQRGALYLLEVSEGGNGCGALYTWLHTEDGAPRVTQEFGTCASYFDIGSDSETVSASMWSTTKPADLVGFVYDGSVMREVTLDPPAGRVAPDDDLEVLLGTHPIAIFRAAEWRPVLRALLGQDFAEAAEIFDLSHGFEHKGAWIAAQADMSPRRGQGRALLAVHRTDGRVVVAWRAAEAIPVIRGTPDAPLNDLISEVFAQ